MIRHGDDTDGEYYILYLEYLGGVIPLLKGKRASKLRPEFTIYDPKIRNESTNGRDVVMPDDLEGALLSSDLDSEDSEPEVVLDTCGRSPLAQRRRRMRKPFTERRLCRDGETSRPIDDTLYDDNLPEVTKHKHTSLHVHRHSIVEARTNRSDFEHLGHKI